jgi:hypothetical protein
MNRASKLNHRKPPTSAILVQAAGIVAVGSLFLLGSPAQAEHGGHYCDAERGNACNDHESSTPSTSRSGPVTDPATPAEPDPPADPEPTPETPT